MEELHFSQVLKNASIDKRKEYDRLYWMFYLCQIEGYGQKTTLREYFARDFIRIPFRGTCISLEDFDDTYGIHFEKEPQKDTDLISLCEYSYNLAKYYLEPGSMGCNIQLYIRQVERVIEAIGYMANEQDGITDFVPKDQTAIAVAEIVDPSLSYKVLEYNHHSMKGDLERKRTILLALADRLEPRRSELKNIDKTLESNLFFLLNRMNIRHNNVETDGKFVSNMNNEELENWYDETYQVCLLAFLELDNVERNVRIKELKEKNK